MQKTTPQSETLLLLLARQADSLCAIIQSWANACYWGHLSMCHSTYDLFARLDDIGPQQHIILLGRPEMMSSSFLTTIRQKQSSLYLIHWNSRIQDTSEQHRNGVAESAVITVCSTDQLTGAIGTLKLLPACEPVRETPTPKIFNPETPKPTEKRPFDPKDYRLSGEEINALLGGMEK